MWSFRGRLNGELRWVGGGELRFTRQIWRVKFLDSHTILLSELYRKTNLAELAVNNNSPNC